MKGDFEGARLYVRPGSTDLRKGVTGLLAIIENEMHMDALSNSVFFFCNKSHKLLKIMVLEVDDFESRLEEAGLEEGETTDPAEWEIKKRSN